MCGRFVGFRPLEDLMTHFPIDVADAEVTENFNVAPTQEVLSIVRQDDQNRLLRLNWGLVPFWAKDKSIGAKMINARSETAASKPSFRTAFRKRRCLILADGNPFAFGGLWEEWDDKGRVEPYRSCTILNREASESVRPIHHRMPVILKPEAYSVWLDPSKQDPEGLQEIIKGQMFTELKAVPVSKEVNSVRNNRMDNIRPVDQELPL